MGETGKTNIAYVNISLIAVNIIYFLFLEIAGSTEDSYFMMNHGALYWVSVIEDKEYFRLLTSMFMHQGIDHIINNMIILFVLGEKLEHALGRIKYLIFYITSGLCAGIVSMSMNMFLDKNVYSVGASGAIFGVIGGLLYAVLINRGQLEDLSTRQLLVVIGFSLYFGFTSMNVDNIAHVSGLIFGILLAILLYRKPKRTGYYERYK